MILITGAAGKTGRAVISALIQKGEVVRSLVHKTEDHDIMKRLGVTEVLVGEMTDPDFFETASKGITSVYHICPNVNAEEIIIGQSILNAAKRNEVQHFVYHSVLHPQIEKMPHHWKKMRVEEILFESGVPYTILQPAAYMQNILAEWSEINKAGTYLTPYSVQSRISVVDLMDVAEVAAIVLTQPGHLYSVYELAGPEPLSQIEIAQILSETLGRPVVAKEQSSGEWEQRIRKTGMNEYAIHTLLKMFDYYNHFGLVGNSKVLEGILQRKPTCFMEFLNRHLTGIGKI